MKTSPVVFLRRKFGVSRDMPEQLPAIKTGQGYRRVSGKPISTEMLACYQTGPAPHAAPYGRIAGFTRAPGRVVSSWPQPSDTHAEYRHHWKALSH